MIRGVAPIVFSVLIVQVASAAGQSPTNLRYSDADAVCQTYGDSELLFVGRGEEPITFHISGEAEIEKARQNLISTEAEIARLSIQSGRVVVRALLPNNLTIVNKSALTFAVSDGGCRALPLTVELNGRVRGRIISASGSSLDSVELILRTEHADRFTVSSNDLRITGHPKTDGTFELSGVPPGSYILSAGVERMEAGKRRYLVTFFPGTSELTAAVPIVVGNATLDDGFDFLVTTE